MPIEPALLVSHQTGRRERGLTLAELLVAVSISAIALSAAWPWFWNAAASAQALTSAADAATAAAFACRTIENDLELATGLLPVPPDVSAEHAIRIRHRHPGEGEEDILIQWDQVRQVLWRKAAGSYLADHVDSFVVTYLDRQGSQLSPNAMTTSAGIASIATLRLRVTVVCRNQRSTVVANVLVDPL